MATSNHTRIASGVDWRTLVIVATPLWIIIAVLIDSALAGGLAQ